MAIPDGLGLLRTYLAAHADITPKPVVTRVPDPRPAEWIQVRRSGGSKLPPVRDRVRADVFAWAATEPAAMALLLEVRRIVNALRGTTAMSVEVYRVEETMGPNQIDDDLSGQPGAWMTVMLTIRAEDLVY